ncbi:hypothetical protein FRX31_019744 [Thalictrum thalictroides]|uniref:RNase H type-1 domain-containing protein n=1 Tax=Thalictrum thalictroides TaxID=46969 RepID=A0A7J6W144_THATH|nr:hypothetical protein FRX31_019744 [Thalictrum thalictroides]
MIHSLIPVVILWELWLERCRRRHLDTLFLGPNHKKAIIFKVRHWAIRLSDVYSPKSQSSQAFSSMAKLLGIPDKNPPTKPPTLVFWTRPPDTWMVLNTDGAAANDHASGGGTLRDRNAIEVANFFAYYGEGSNNLAETRAILDGIILSKSLGFRKIQIQTDSKLARNWFNSKNSIPFHLKRWWEIIHDECKDLVTECIHIYREANNVADYLAKTGLKHQSNGGVNRHNDQTYKKLIKGDAIGLPYLRYNKHNDKGRSITNCPFV